MSASIETDRVMTVPSGVGNAVGVEKPSWYVAIVKNNTEKSVLDKLTKLEYECYVPLQSELRVWRNGRKTKVERVVIPTLVFVNCTESSRKEIIKYPYILRFMTNMAGSFTSAGNKPLAKIPDTQIKTLQFILNQSNEPIEFSSKPIKKGDKVRVVRGDFIGLEGEVFSLKNTRSNLIIDFDFLGCVKLSIYTDNLEIVM